MLQHLSPNDPFSDIRPFSPRDEVKSAIQRLINDPEAGDLLKGLLYKSGLSLSNVEYLEEVNQVKEQIIAPILRSLMKKTSFSVTSSGKSGLDHSLGKKYTYISNHRDIILDSALLNLVLMDAELPIPEIAIGDNLLLKPWIKDVVRLAGAFVVKRSPSVREMLDESRKLSLYMRRNIEEGLSSQWIAQREGRAKDSNDRTQPSVLKMLGMSGNDSEGILESLSRLNITPVTYSYEYDPCDYLKALELLQKARGTYKKEKKISDLLSMKTGLTGYKGRIHIAFGDPLECLIANSSIDFNGLSKNDALKCIASIIDDCIFEHYRFYPGNYISYDLLYGTNNDKEGLYSKRERLKFELYIEDQLDRLKEFKETKGERDFLYRQLLSMYSNPLKNYLELKKTMK